MKLANMILERKNISAISFIQGNFNRKECVHYVHQDNEFNATLPRDKPCFCGGVELDHQTKAKAEFVDQMPRFLVSGDERINHVGHMDHESMGKTLSDSLSDSMESPKQENGEDPGIENKTLVFYNEEISGVAHLEVNNEEMNAEKISVSSEKQWTASTSIQEFTTNAYGQIEFDENLLKAAKYMRLADNDKCEGIHCETLELDASQAVPCS